MKRIVMILGGKGGTGKTAFTRLLLDVMHSKGINYLAYDADTENPELYEYYQNFGSGVRLLNFLLDQAKPELEKAGAYLGLQQLEVLVAAESNTSTSKPAKVTASTSRRGQKKTNEQQ